MATIDINQLTAEQKQQLREQFEEEERAAKATAQKQRDYYEILKDEQVQATFKRLQNLSSTLEEEKIDIFNQFGSLIAMKKDLFHLSDEQMDLQQSHTFTNKSVDKSIIIGANVIDRWSDDLNIGIARISEWLDKHIEEDQSREIIRALLRPDSNGILKANRILDLSKKAAEIGDKELIEAVNFIRDQYRPAKTSTYVKAKFLDSNRQWQWLALSMSAI
jgi:hypothetical protein